MIKTNKTYVVSSGHFKGRYVVPIFKQSDGKYMCDFTGEHRIHDPVAFNNLITIAEHKKRQMNET